MDVIELARQQRRGIVTTSGSVVRFYDENCNGEIHGVIESSDGVTLTKWKLDGKSAASDYMNLVPYNVRKHFDWRVLPGWANAWVFKQGADWYCTSMKPTYRKPLRTDLMAGSWVPNKNANTYILPELVSKDILWDCTSEESLTCNPKYNEEEVS